MNILFILNMNTQCIYSEIWFLLILKQKCYTWTVNMYPRQQKSHNLNTVDSTWLSVLYFRVKAMYHNLELQTIENNFFGDNQQYIFSNISCTLNWKKKFKT